MVLGETFSTPTITAGFASEWAGTFRDGSHRSELDLGRHPEFRANHIYQNGDLDRRG